MCTVCGLCACPVGAHLESCEYHITEGRENNTPVQDLTSDTETE